MIIAFDDLAALREKYRNSRIVFGGGIYDLIHIGHVEGLSFRKSLGDILVCGVVSDKRAKQRKRIPVRFEADRLAVLDAFRDVDYTFIMPMPRAVVTPTMQVIQRLRPDIYVEYCDNKDRWADEDRQHMKVLGTELVFDTLPKRSSTTEIIEKIKKRAAF